MRYFAMYNELVYANKELQIRLRRGRANYFRTRNELEALQQRMTPTRVRSVQPRPTFVGRPVGPHTVRALNVYFGVALPSRAPQRRGGHSGGGGGRDRRGAVNAFQGTLHRR